MLATINRIDYLQELADKAQEIKRAHPSLIPKGLYHQTFRLGLTTEQVELRIQMYRNILKNCHLVLPKREVQKELFPES